MKKLTKQHAKKSCAHGEHGAACNVPSVHGRVEQTADTRVKRGHRFGRVWFPNIKKGEK